MNYILMGDVINSRKKDTKILWNDLNEIIKKSNYKYHDFMLSPLEIKSGDEFQVIMKDIQSSLKLLSYLNTYLMYKDIKTRFVIGYGKIESTINSYSENNMLGQGLTETYEVLNNKKDKNKYRFYIENDEKTSILLNSIGNLLTEIEKKITKKQYEYLYNKIVLDYDIDTISNKLNVTSRNIYDLEERSKYKLFQNIFISIEKVLT